MENFFEEHSSVFSSYSCKIKKEVLEHYSSNISLIEKLFTAGSSMLSLYDLSTQKYIYIHPRYSKLLGKDATKEMMIKSADFYDRVHPDDLNPLVYAEVQAFKLLYGMPAPVREEYKIVTFLRIRKDDGSYTRILRRVIDFRESREGKSWLLLIAADIIEEKATELVEVPLLFNRETRYIYLIRLNEPCMREKFMLSERELEVLQLAGTATTSKIIAGKLCLSPHTISSHRKNILKHFSTHNISQVHFLMKRLEVF